MIRELFLHTATGVFFSIFAVIISGCEPSSTIKYSDNDKLVEIKQRKSIEIGELAQDITKAAETTSLPDEVNGLEKKEKKLAPEIDFFVSLNGTKDGTGTVDKPFRTLEDARNIARKLKNNSVNIWLRDGRYFLRNTFYLSEIDSRSPIAPLKFAAWKDENVSIVGGMSLKNWHKVTNQNILTQLPEVAKSHVIVTNLIDQKIFKYGSPKGDGIELFCNDEAMTLSRWPNKGFSSIAGLVESSIMNPDGLKESKIGQFFFTDDHLLKWKNENDIWLHGYWFWDWSDQRQKVQSVDFDNKIISLQKPYHHYGYRVGQWFYAFNLLCEVDQENEWYLDRDNGLLYFWPPNEKAIDTVVSTLDTLVDMRGTAYISLENINFLDTKATAIVIENSDHVNIGSSAIKNTGSWGIKITNSTYSGVSSCDISQTGDGGVYLDGGDRPTLTAGNLFVNNSTIHDYARINRTYKPAISLNGVGNTVSHNHIYNAPHVAIFFAGNNHNIEYNNIHDVVRESNDAGAIYGLRDWSQYGTVIQNNFLHHIHANKHDKSAAIYLDDQLSGVTVRNNIIYKTNRGILAGGGKFNIIENNILMDNSQSIYFDARGVYQAEKSLDLFRKLKAQQDFNVKLYSSVKNRLELITDKTCVKPIDNVVQNNIIVNDKDWSKNISGHVGSNGLVKNNYSLQKIMHEVSGGTINEIMSEAKPQSVISINFNSIGNH